MHKIITYLIYLLCLEVLSLLMKITEQLQQPDIVLYSEFLLIFILSHTVCTYVILHSYKKGFVNI